MSRQTTLLGFVGKNEKHKLADEEVKQPPVKQNKHRSSGFYEPWLKKYLWLRYDGPIEGKCQSFLYMLQLASTCLAW